MDADEGGSGWIILLVLFLFVLGGIGAGGFFYWRQTQELNPVLSTKEAFSNPMMVR